MDKRIMIITNEEALIRCYQNIEETLNEMKIADASEMNGNNSILSRHYIYLAKLYMLVKRDEEKFRFYMKIAAEMYVELANRKMKGENVSDLILLVTNYQMNMLFLAAGCIQEVEEYAKILWGYYKYQKMTTREYHIFMILMVHTFYRLVLNEDGFEEWIEKFYELSNSKQGKPYYICFVKMMDGIYKKDSNLIESGLDDVIKYKGSIKRSNMDATGNADFCYWAIGLCNLAISRGIGFKFPQDEYLPHKLLMTPNKVELKEVIKEKKPKKEKK